ncbi:MAG TPA: hypothetical protein PLI09_19325 [Candidatus Hydrogenedentes bacterium]|nr:hypothetical protein [Candidatus Hydrogenedentota bacterium]
MATENDLLTARIVCRAVLPVIKVALQDDPKVKKNFANVTGTVQFLAKDPAGPVGAHLKFEKGELEVVQELIDNPDLQFTFSSVAKMNAMFAGKMVLFGIKGFTKVGLLIKILGVLMGLKILMPTAKPKNPLQAYLKVKMTLYMVSTALSQLNKFGDEEMKKWTERQPERIYQWSVDGTDIACWLKIKAGQTKAGRGMYERRQPFVHMRFTSVDNALPVLSNSVDTVSAIATGLVISDGSPEYGGKLGDFMLKIAALLS